jgi:hypothetical protein
MGTPQSLVDVAEERLTPQEREHANPYNMSKMAQTSFSITHQSDPYKIQYVALAHELEREFNKTLDWAHKNPNISMPGSKFQNFCTLVWLLYQTCIQSPETVDDHDKKALEKLLKNCLKLVFWETHKIDRR